jgi:NADH-quinone oxidoreductase subunit C
MTATRVEAPEWTSTLAGLREAGYRFLDYLTAIDRLASVEVVAHLVDPDTGKHLLVSAMVAVPDGTIASVTHLFPGANWHEREAAEMFGIVFSGHPDPRPLLLRAAAEGTPMLKSTVLSARADAPWPGGR